MVLHNAHEHLWVLVWGSPGSNTGRSRDACTWCQESHCLPCTYAAILCPAALFALSTTGPTRSTYVFLPSWGVVVHSMQGGTADLGLVNALCLHSMSMDALPLHRTMGTLCEPRGKVGTYNC